MLSTHSAWLLSSLVQGCDGLLSGAGSVIANLQVALFEAFKKGDLEEARSLNDRIYPTDASFLRRPVFRYAQSNERSSSLSRSSSGSPRSPAADEAY